MHVRISLLVSKDPIVGQNNDAAVPFAFRDTLPDSSRSVFLDGMDELQDRDTLPEAGQLESDRGRVTEMNIELAGTESEVNERAKSLLGMLEREVRAVARDWQCSIDVIPSNGH
jgi:hypothetical protein